MNFLKKNQLVIYVIALMLVVAGYFNYTSSDHETVNSTIADLNTQVGNIGDATLVSSNDIVSGTNTNSNTENTNAIANNTTNNTNQTNTSTDNTTTQTSASNNNNTSDYFVKSKLDRDSMYSEMLETYEKVLNSSNSLETQKQSATEEITKINNTKNSIMVCENLLSTKGFDNSVVFVNGDSINVIVKSDDLDKNQIAQIQNIVTRELSADISNIHIATK